MMSHYGLPFEYDEHWICGALELSIETLAGTAFEIRVSPNDTIMAIKSKIQSVEGIPVSQQHLLYNLEELDNSASVRDYSIQNGATLKLVLSMRGGPISTKRIPPSDEMAWRELQELMSVTRKDDFLEKLPTGSRVTVLVFRDGDQVNLLRVVENEDGSFSPLSESWNGSSVRNLFAEKEPEQTAKRLQENSVTMGKMQELKEKLESLSIQRKEKKCEDATSVIADEYPSTSSYLSESSRTGDLPKRNAFVNYQSGDYSRATCVKLIRKTEQELELEEPAGTRPRSRLVSCSKASMAALTKARKEAESLIRMQSNLSILVDSEPNPGYRLRRTPLPDIHRTPRANDDDEKKSDDEDLGKNLREKTARSIAIVEEENDLTATAPATASICSSRSSIVGLPSNEGVAIAYSEIPQEGVSATVGRSRFRVSRYVLDNDERPKTTPAKLDDGDPGSSRQFYNLPLPEPESRNRTTHVLSPFSSDPPRVGSRNQVDIQEEKKSDPPRNQPKKRASTLVRNPSSREEASTLSTSTLPAVVDAAAAAAAAAVPSPPPPPPPPPPPVPSSSSNSFSSSSTSCTSSLPPAPVVPLSQLSSVVAKKRLRCSQCKKKLNITNTYTCRCGRMFCAVHRYSEVHNCHFDYKEEGRRILQETNPLVVASKLPKI